MKLTVRISTVLYCSADELWNKIIDPSSLKFVASPVLTFVPEGQTDDDLPDEWNTGVSYQMKLRLFGLIPLGRHTIRLVKIDRENRTIESRESGSLAKVWNHTISFRETSRGIVTYTDVIELDAGLLTPVVWLFSQLFYRHRQRRWKILLRKTQSPEY